MRILEAINLNETVPIVALIYLLALVGQQMTLPNSESARWSARVAGGTFISYAVAGLCAWPPSRVLDAVAIVVRAILAGGLLWTIARIALPSFFFVWNRSVGAVLREIEAARAKEASDRWWAYFSWVKEREYEEKQRQLKEENELQEERARPINRDAIAGEAKHRYEKKLAIIESANMEADEKVAATMKAKQQYFRELNEAI